jgi:8-oxo-dGTP diphosphatase
MKTLLVAAALIIEHGKILITQRRERDHCGLLWEFPGGKVNEGEDPKEALNRELEEELGIEAETSDIFDAAFHVYPEYPVLLLAYRCRVRKGIPRPLGCRDLRWVDIEALQGFMMPPADDPIRAKLVASHGMNPDAFRGDGESISG